MPLVKLHLLQLQLQELLKRKKRRPQTLPEEALSLPLTKLQHTTSAVLQLFAVLVVTTKVLNKTI